MKKITGKITGLIVLLLSIALAPINGTMAQIICDISIDTPPPVCPDIYFELSVFEEPDLIFNWQKKKGIHLQPLETNRFWVHQSLILLFLE